MRRTVHTSAAGGRSGGLVSIATNDTQGMGPFMLRGAHVPGESSMNMSAILVLVRPDRMDAAVATLNDTCGVEVHCRDDATGRLIVVLEAPSIDDEVAGMRGIQALPSVLSAELVCHYFAEDESVAASMSAVRDHVGEADDPALMALNSFRPA